MFWSDLLGKRKTLGFLPAVAAATTTESHPLFVAPQKCRVTLVDIIPQAAVTGDNSNTKQLNIVNRGSAGSGSTEVGNLDLTLAVNLVAMDLKNIPLAAAYLDPIGVELAAGDVLALEYEKTGNGVAMPDCISQITWEPAAA
jgi:hypothetical protein